MSTLFETPVLFSIFTFHWDLQNESLDRERTEKTFREAIFERHYFICLQNKCTRQCMTGLRTDGRTYVRTYVRTWRHNQILRASWVTTISLTNGAPQAAFGRWSSANNYYRWSEYCGIITEPKENNSFSIIAQVIIRAIAFFVLYCFCFFFHSSKTLRNPAAAILKISASVL